MQDSKRPEAEMKAPRKARISSNFLNKVIHFNQTTLFFII